MGFLVNFTAMNKTRRKFLHTSLLLGAGTALLSACGDDDIMTDAGPVGGNDSGPAIDSGPATDSGPSSCTATDGVISSNHGHTVAVPAADVAAGADVTYDIQGTSGHAHTLTVSAADFATLAGGTGVSVESSDGAGHTHSVMITCA
ncbi:MAG: hypothetical protein ACI9KE_001859 [Polyangiales bacterium]